MNTMLLKLFVAYRTLLTSEQGQDLVEYALAIALIALGATASMQGVAAGINGAFYSVSAALATDI